MDNQSSRDDAQLGPRHVTAVTPAGWLASVKVATVVLPAFAIYWQDFVVVANEAVRSDIATHIIAIPLLLLYLLYRRRKVAWATILQERREPGREAVPVSALVGGLLFTLAIVTYWHGSCTFQPLEYHLASLPVLLAGCILLLFGGPTLRAVAFPLAFLLLLIPPPETLAYLLGSAMASFSSQAAYLILKTAGLPVKLASEYGTPVIIAQTSLGTVLPFAIDVACSGIYSLIGFATFSLFTAYIARGTLWKKLIMLLIGFPLIYSLNILRITLIVSIGYWQGLEAALNAFHLLGGWALIFLGTLILLLVSERALRIGLFTKRTDSKPCSYHNPVAREQGFCSMCGKLLALTDRRISRKDLAKIAAVMIAVVLVTSIQVPVFALTQGPAGVIVQTPFGTETPAGIFPTIPGYDLRYVYRDTGFENVSKQDRSLTYAYVPTHSPNQRVWISLEVANSLGYLHAWEVCLVTWPQEHGYQPSVESLDLRDIKLLENPPITGRFFAFRNVDSNFTQVVLYWFEQAVFNTGLGFERKYVKLSLIAFTNEPALYAEAEASLLPIGEAVAAYWQPVKTWSTAALGIAEYAYVLAAATIVSSAVVIALGAAEAYARRRRNLRLFNDLALEEERNVLRAVNLANKGREATGNAVASTYQRLTGEQIQPDRLVGKLREAEEAGLVEKAITSREDEPILVWRSQVSLRGKRIM